MFFRQFPEIRDEDIDLHALALWVDAICINQFDMEERNSQVQHMGQIYQHATSLIAWLRPKQDLPCVACEIARLSAKGISSSLTPVSWLDDYVDHLCMKSESFSGDFVARNDAWDCVKDLFNRPYWERVWTFQEVVLA